MRRLIALVVLISVGLAVLGTSIMGPRLGVVAGSCVPGDFQSSQRAITEQTAALSARDFRSARNYSSKSFRENVSEDQFIGIIAQQYTFLLRNPRITFDQCDQQGPKQMFVVASFDVAGVGTQLRYVMVNEANGWFVSAAEATRPRSLSA